MSATSTCSSTDQSFIEHKQNILDSLSGLFKSLDLQATNIQYLSKGCYNKVYRFDLQQACHENLLPCIIRINNLCPVDDNYDEDGELTKEFQQELAEAYIETLDLAAILRTLSHGDLRMPELIHVDGTTENVLKRPYTIQTRLPGQPLGDVWRQLGFSEKQKVVGKVADFNLKAESVIFPTFGDLKAMEAGASKLEIQEWDAEQPSVLDGAAPPALTLGDWCVSSISKHQAHRDEDEDEESADERRSVYVELNMMRIELSADPRFKHLFFGKNVTNVRDAHFKRADLYMDNILLDHPDENTFDIGIIDLDGAQSLPTILSRDRPTYLWQWDRLPEEIAFSAWDGNVAHTPGSFRDFRDEPHGAEVKAHYDSYVMNKLRSGKGPAAAEEWWDHTYGNGVLVRRLADLCIHGFHEDRGRADAARELIDEWEEMRRVEGLKLSLPLQPAVPPLEIEDLSAMADERSVLEKIGNVFVKTF